MGMEGLVGAICFLTLLPPTWQVPFLSLSISLINTMCLPQYPPNASPAQSPTLARLSEVAPNPPHPAGGLGWPHAPPKQLPLWGGPVLHTSIPAAVTAGPHSWSCWGQSQPSVGLLQARPNHQRRAHRAHMGDNPGAPGSGDQGGRHHWASQDTF